MDSNNDSNSMKRTIIVDLVGLVIIELLIKKKVIIELFYKQLDDEFQLDLDHYHCTSLDMALRCDDIHNEYIILKPTYKIHLL